MWRQALKSTGRTIVDFALPPRCPGCGEVQEENHLFCGSCWGSMHWLSGGCARCGLPLEAGGMDECGRCLADPPPFERVRAAVAYGDMPRKLVVKLKYGRKVGIAETLARYMAPLASVGEGEPPLLVPVPLHRWRLWSRGFNQSLLLARALAKAGKGEVAPGMLTRVRQTRPLKGMSGSQRRTETRGAFRAVVNDPSLKARRIILVDDVLTSGSTAEACARALRKAGMKRIEVLAFARVVAHAGADGQEMNGAR